MGKLARIKDLIISIFMIVFAFVLLIWPQYGPPVIMVIFGAALLFYGIYSLIFYCTRAVHMVGGKSVFYKSVLLMDLGVFMLSAFKGSERLVMLYLLVLLAASGAIDIVRALEFRKQGAGWVLRAIAGVVTILLLIVGFIYRKDPSTMVYVFCIGLLYSAATRIVAVFRKTAVVYIPQ